MAGGAAQEAQHGAVTASYEEQNAITLSDIDKFLFENFRSLYENEFEEAESKMKDSKKMVCPFESPRLLDHPPPPENLCRSDRFFISTGSSGSLVTNEASSSSTSAMNNYF